MSQIVTNSVKGWDGGFLRIQVDRYFFYFIFEFKIFAKNAFFDRYFYVFRPERGCVPGGSPLSLNFF